MQKKLDPTEVKKFKNTIRLFYHKRARVFPWRTTFDPYHILVSEIMLQQTQAHRVQEKFLQFMHTFPSVQTLAQAPQQQVLLRWSGLGYNRRALYLHRTAKEIMTHWKGVVPSSPDTLQTLPGIGPYTARAIAAFAYNKPKAFIETNIRTVYLTHFFPRARKKVPDEKIMPLIESTMDRKNPRRWFSALMDYGASLKTSGNRTHRYSASYVRQSPFKGSYRQIRGMVIRLLLEHHTLSRQALKKALMKEERVIEEVLISLIKEGMIKKTAQSYVLA